MSLLGTVRVPNEGNPKAKIYVIGEAPGVDEVDEKRPFVGASGTLLRNCLNRAGLLDSDVFFGNLCQYRPPDNKFAIVYNSETVKNGIAEILSLLAEHRPNVVVALGNWPLYFLTGNSGRKVGTGIAKWRGSILHCSGRKAEDIKVVASYHPAYVVRQRAEYPIFDTDIKRAVYESTFPEFNYPTRDVVVVTDENRDHWVKVLSESDRLAVDIESVKKSTHILCVGFSPNPKLSVVFPHSDTNYRIRESIDIVLRSPAKKIFHNGGAFDIPMLHLNGYEVNNFWWDTMAAQHVMWVELPKSLEYLTSIYTRQPYYKTSGRAEIPEDAKAWGDKVDRQKLYEYNGTDTSVTAEIQLAQEKEMNEGPEDWKKVFQFELDCMGPAERIGTTGLLIDLERREKLERALITKWGILQFILDGLTGYKTNVNSTKAMPKILYDKDKLGLPPRKNREGRLTTDEDAIVGLIAFTKDKMAHLKPGGSANIYWQTRYEILKLVLVIRGVRKLLSSYIRNPISSDGRIRSIYKSTSTDTWRWASALFFDGTGANGQTFPREAIELKDFEMILKVLGDDARYKELLDYIRGDLEEDTKSGEDSDSVDDSSGEGLLASEL